MTRYRLPMRWADLDQLNHVNNVVYLEYAAEARAALVDAGTLDAGLEDVAIGIDFVRPMLLSTKLVEIDQEVDGDRLTQEVTQVVDGERVVFARVHTRLGGRGDLGPPAIDGEVVQFRGRRGDLDARGHVDPVRYFEYFQEARIITMAHAWSTGELGRMVVARLDVDYGPPVGWRHEPWEMTTAVTRVGGKSFHLSCEWRDGDVVVARNTAVLVGFDVETQSSRALEPAEIAYLEGWGRTSPSSI